MLRFENLKFTQLIFIPQFYRDREHITITF